MLVNVFDTSIDSDNLGDEIIMDAVWDIIRPLFPDATFIRTPSHRRATLAELRAGRAADISIVGGTNILKSHMLVRSNWKITPLDYVVWRNVVLMGVGWQQYGGEADALTRLFFKTVLSKKHLHSVRDMHTYDKLHQHVPNTIYTACPTMWELDAQRCSAIPVQKARHAVFAVTYYRPAPEADRRLFEMLRKHYDKIYFWPQQAMDVPYVRQLGLEGMIPIDPSIAAYNRVLDQEDVDFVGSRLHGGIRALQRGRRAMIVPVDNRATEISKSSGLPVVSRDEPEAIERWITQPAPVKVVLPVEAMEIWKNQFLLGARRSAQTA
jgi:polysaccharide pyruvyl transferase WcaK-like protein